MSNLLQNFCINLRTRILFLNSFIRNRLVYACQCWNINLYQMNLLEVTYRPFLRRMIRGSFRFIDKQNNDYGYQISNDQLQDICGTGNLSIFVQRQQFSYATHIVCMPLSRSTKLLMFTNDHNTRRGRPVKTLLDHVLKNTNMTVDQFCTLALSKKLGRPT